MHRTRSTCCARTASGHARRARLILACGDVDSWAPSSAREQGADIPLYFRTFLQLDVSEGRTQHESGSASFGIKRRELVWINVTANPSAEWIAGQVTEAFPWNEAPRYLIR